MDTLLLNRDGWDLALNSAANIAVASDPYSQTQDVASAARLFEGELWFDTTKGIPYFGQILGRNYPIPVFREQAAAAALSVPGVSSARVVISSLTDRTLRGQIQIETEDGATSAVALGDIE